MLYLCADPSAAQPAPLSQCLDTILLSPDAGACFDYLEEQGLLLGNGGFLLTLLCPREGLVLPGQESFCADVARAFRTHLPHRQSLVSLTGGDVYGLLAFPRLCLEKPLSSEAAQGLNEGLISLYQSLSAGSPLLILQSPVFYGEQTIWQAALALRRAKAYHAFCQTRTGLIPVSLEPEDGLSQALADYHALASQVVSELGGPHADTKKLSVHILEEILAHSIASLDSVGQQYRLFLHCFSQTLIRTASISTSALQENQHLSHTVLTTDRALLDALRMLLDQVYGSMHHRLDHEIRGKMLEIRQYIDENIPNYELSIRFLSERFQITPARLNANFKKYYGEQLSRYLRMARFRYAQGLILAHEDWTMTQVAAAAGYSDISTMYRVFQVEAGVTPARLRSAQETGE